MEGAQLDRDKRDEAVEQADHVEEPAGDVLGDEDRDVVVLGIALPLDVPVLDGADDVRLVGLAELDLDFVPPVGLGVLKQQVKASSTGLWPLAIPQHEVPKPQQGRVLADAVLEPLLVQVGVGLEPDPLGLGVLGCWHVHTSRGWRRAGLVHATPGTAVTTNPPERESRARTPARRDSLDKHPGCSPSADLRSHKPVVSSRDYPRAAPALHRAASDSRASGQRGYPPAGSQERLNARPAHPETH